MAKKCTALWREACSQAKNVQNTPAPDHFWKLRCRKNARRCGAKHISIKIVQNTPCSDHFWKLRCRKVHGVVARNTFPSQNSKNTTCSDHFLTFRCRKNARCCGAKHISKSKVSKTAGFEPLFDVQRSTECIALHYSILHYKTLHYTTLHYTPLHYTALHWRIHTRSNGTKWPLWAICPQVALLALTYLTTGVVPASKAPLLDTSPVGAVEGLIGAGPLIVVSQSLTDFPKTLLRPSTDLPETFHRSSTDLSRIFHRSGTHKNQKSLNSFSRITASFLASAPHP